MGASDVVPGVSGGTMAFILGIYEELIKAIRSFDMDFIRLIGALRMKEAAEHVSLAFLMSLGMGILIAIFSLARLISWLLENQPVMIWSFFMGLILASIFIVSRYLKKWDIPIISFLILGLIFSYIIVGIVPGTTPDRPWFLFLSGAIAICAMILPGISGSFILVLLGKYQYILEAVNNRNFLTLLIVSAGAVCGLLAFSRILNWLLRKYHDLTIAVLAGLMLGSLRKVWPWKSQKIIPDTGQLEITDIPIVNILPDQFNVEVLISIILLLAGFLTVFLITRFSEHDTK